LLLDLPAPLFWRGLFSNVVQSEIDPVLHLGVPGFIQYDTSGAGLPAPAARLGPLYIVIATSIHASIVLLASR